MLSCCFLACTQNTWSGFCRALNSISCGIVLTSRSSGSSTCKLILAGWNSFLADDIVIDQVVSGVVWIFYYCVMGAQTSSAPLSSMLEDGRPESGGCRWMMVTAYTRVRELGWDADECQVPILRSMHRLWNENFASDRIETVAIVDLLYKHEQRVYGLASVSARTFAASYGHGSIVWYSHD